MHAGKRSVGESGAWRPDLRASFGLAVAAMLLVTAGFAALFRSAASVHLLSPIAAVRERLVFSSPPPPLPPRRPRRRAPVFSMPAPIPVPDQPWPPLLPPISVPAAFTAQEYLKERAAQDAAALRGKVTGGSLGRELGKTTGMPALRDNQSIPTAGGDRMVRSGDSCAQIHTVQGSPSPTNKIDLAEPMAACPGSSGQSISDALEEWAKKTQRSQPPPP